MTITVSTSDPRSVKALAVLATADRWHRGHTKAGRSFYAIPSSDGRHVYWTDTRECTCPDFARRGVACKHVLAVRLRVAQLTAAEPKPSRAELAARYDAIFGADDEDGLVCPLVGRLSI